MILEVFYEHQEPRGVYGFSMKAQTVINLKSDGRNIKTGLSVVDVMEWLEDIGPGIIANFIMHGMMSTDYLF